MLQESEMLNAIVNYVQNYKVKNVITDEDCTLEDFGIEEYQPVWDALAGVDAEVISGVELLDVVGNKSDIDPESVYILVQSEDYTNIGKTIEEALEYLYYYQDWNMEEFDREIEYDQFLRDIKPEMYV